MEYEHLKIHAEMLEHHNAELRDYCNRLRTKWLPIESAPKDGTRIDLWANGLRFTESFWGREHFPGDEADTNEPECWVSLDFNTTYDMWQWMDIELEPTHWMPLPPQPASE